MKLENKIIVKASIETVWGLLENIEAVASCVPGASAEKINDDEYTIVMSVRLGPLQMSYGGLLKIVDRDPDNYRVTFNAKAKDKKGQGTAASKTVASLISTGDETQTNRPDRANGAWVNPSCCNTDHRSNCRKYSGTPE